MNAREAILGRVRTALQNRSLVEHPGSFEGWRASEPDVPNLERFERMFSAAGGEVVRVPDGGAGAAWVSEFTQSYASVVIGSTVPEELQPKLRRVEAERAEVGVSMARGAIGETGSLMLDARDGRRAQLLAPVHIVFLRAADVHPTLLDALHSVQGNAPSAVGLHSGPSKSADIGQILVKGVHGPGRIISVVIDS